jgi:hypothetical protein
MTGAVTIHFEAGADTEGAAVHSREVMIAALHTVLTDDRVVGLLTSD